MGSAFLKLIRELFILIRKGMDDEKNLVLKSPDPQVQVDAVQDGETR